MRYPAIKLNRYWNLAISIPQALCLRYTYGKLSVSRMSSVLESILLLQEVRSALAKRKARALITVDIGLGTFFDRQVELVLAETKRYQLRQLHLVWGGPPPGFGEEINQQDA